MALKVIFINSLFWENYVLETDKKQFEFRVMMELDGIVKLLGLRSKPPFHLGRSCHFASYFL